MKKLRRFSLDGVAGKLKEPSCHEEAQRSSPQPVNPWRQHEKRQRQHDEGYTQGVADPVDRVLVAAAILWDPLVPASSA